MHTLAFTLLAILLATSLLASTLTVDFAEAKKRYKVCSPKILVKAVNVIENLTYTATVTIGDNTKTKSGTVDVNETSIALPLKFKKLGEECPFGETVFGNVNGTGFEVEIESLKKPNKVTVTLP